ncbi:MAG: hypothetical protein AB7O24_17020 [Kofleriaceae bacterium]
MNRLCWIALVLASACNESPSSSPDAPVLMDSTPPPNVVTVNIGDETPLLVAYRNGDGPWQTLDQSQPLDLRVHNAYQVLAVCGNAAVGYETAIYGAMFEADGATVALPCHTPPAIPTTATITGTMVQPGTIWISGDTQGLSSNWSFELDVPQGEHELVAVAGNKILIRNDVMVSIPATVGTIDVDDGDELEPVPLTVTGKHPSETLSIATVLLTEHDQVMVQGEGNVAKVAPPSQLTSNDHQMLVAVIDSFPAFRYVLTDYHGTDPGSLALPEPLTGVARDPGGVTWSAPLPMGTPELFAVTGANVVRAMASAAYLAARSSLSLVAPVDGYDRDWSVDVAHPDFMSFSVYDVSEMGSTGTSVFWVGGSVVQRTPLHARKAVMQRTLQRLRDRSVR